MGTAGTADYFDYLGDMPKKYFSRGLMEGVERISGASVAETILTGYSACHACVIACGRVVRLTEDGSEQKGPEYETLVGFGPNLWLADPKFATRMGDLCDRYGMDTISVSNVIAFAFQLFEAGIITDEETGGLKLSWGDIEVVEKLVHMIPVREGFGAMLAEGARALGVRFAAKDMAIQVNGLEVPYHDPRGGSGMALVYATSPRGACHNQSDYFIVDIGNAEDEIGMKVYDRHAGAEKAHNVVIHQNWKTIANDLVMCTFGNVMPSEFIDLIGAATGLAWTLEDLLVAGERGWNLKRAINKRMGLKRENDRLPQPLLEPYEDGGAAGFVINFDAMLNAYYEKRGWDWESGKPTRNKLKSLGLDFTADELWPET
jgi:aldehyde:ferredoxin oxidoreductase